MSFYKLRRVLLNAVGCFANDFDVADYGVLIAAACRECLQAIETLTIFRCPVDSL